MFRKTNSQTFKEMNTNYFNQVKYLDWDSTFFNLKIGRIDYNDKISKILNEISLNENFDLIYLFSKTYLNQEEIEMLRNIAEVKLVDKKVTFLKMLDNTKISKIHCNIEEVNESAYNERLYNLALLSGSHSRFKTDVRFKSGSFENLYKTWLNKSLKGEFDDKVFVYMNNGNIDGFITLKIIQDSLIIGLIAVNEVCHGKGIGRSLIARAEHYANENGITKIFVSTQEDNTNAFKFYLSQNFLISAKDYIYHIWF